MTQALILILSFLALGLFGWTITRKLDTFLNSGSFHSLEEQEIEEKQQTLNSSADISDISSRPDQEHAPEEYFSFYSHNTKKPSA